MGFFTTRERAELGSSIDARPRPVRREFTPAAPRRRAAEPDITGHAGLLVQRVTESSVQEIDSLIAQLRQRRQQVLDETARVQREIIGFAQLSQSTMQSTKIISESLTLFTKGGEAPGADEARAPEAEVHSDRAHAEAREEELDQAEEDPPLAPEISDAGNGGLREATSREAGSRVHLKLSDGPGAAREQSAASALE